MNDCKRCSDCKQEKPLSEFYKRPESSLLNSVCKECMKVRSKNQKHLPSTEAREETEMWVISELSKRGIPSSPGKRFFTRSDVVAWGCVLIEVKSSQVYHHLNVPQFAWRFSTKQQKKGISSHLVVLICRYESENTFHIFPADDPMFYRPDGTIKSAVSWTPNSSYSRVYLSDANMKQARDNWKLVNDYLVVITERLKQGAMLTEPQRVTFKELRAAQNAMYQQLGLGI